MADSLGVEGTLTLSAGGPTIGDAVMYQLRSTRARRRTTRFGATGHGYRLGIQDGDVMLEVRAASDGSAIPIPEGSELTFTVKQASGHTANSCTVIVYEVVKTGRSDDDGFARNICLAQMTGTHT